MAAIASGAQSSAKVAVLTGAGPYYSRCVIVATSAVVVLEVYYHVMISGNDLGNFKSDQPKAVAAKNAVDVSFIIKHQHPTNLV